jgi:hypothetical protein
MEVDEALMEAWAWLAGQGLLAKDRPFARHWKSNFDEEPTLHSRGPEYDVQYSVDGIPLYHNRSPAFGQSINVKEFDALKVRTAGCPGEFGFKLGASSKPQVIRICIKACTEHPCRRCFSMPKFPRPVPAETTTVPVDDRFRFHNHKRGSPPARTSGQPSFTGANQN